MSDTKANHIQHIYYSGTLLLPRFDVSINCPFPVKRVRFISLTWHNNNAPPAMSECGMLISNIPGIPFLGFADSISSNKSWDYIYAAPQQISGTWTLEMRRIDGAAHPFPPVAGPAPLLQEIRVVLEFLQE